MRALDPLVWAPYLPKEVRDAVFTAIDVLSEAHSTLFEIDNALFEIDNARLTLFMLNCAEAE